MPRAKPGRSSGAGSRSTARMARTTSGLPEPNATRRPKAPCHAVRRRCLGAVSEPRFRGNGHPLTVLDLVDGRRALLERTVRAECDMAGDAVEADRLELRTVVLRL